MNDLISRQAAIDAFLKELTKRERKNLLHTWSTVEVKYFITELLEKLPSVQERKKGRWIHDGYDSFPNGIDWIHCSKCGKRWINIPADLPKYCPCCGARMEGAEDETLD